MIRNHKKEYIKMKKRFISLFLAVILCSTFLQTTAFAALKGDVDGDGSVTPADARIALRVSVGLDTLTTDQKQLADADGDGTISSADARLILRAAVGLENLNGDEFDDIGTNPDPDAPSRVRLVHTKDYYIDFEDGVWTSATELILRIRVGNTSKRPLYFLFDNFAVNNLILDGSYYIEGVESEGIVEPGEVRFFGRIPAPPEDYYSDGSGLLNGYNLTPLGTVAFYYWVCEVDTAKMELTEVIDKGPAGVVDPELKDTMRYNPTIRSSDYLEWNSLFRLGFYSANSWGFGGDYQGKWSGTNTEVRLLCQNLTDETELLYVDLLEVNGKTVQDQNGECEYSAPLYPHHTALPCFYLDYYEYDSRADAPGGMLNRLGLRPDQVTNVKVSVTLVDFNTRETLSSQTMTIWL